MLCRNSTATLVGSILKGQHNVQAPHQNGEGGNINKGQAATPGGKHV